MQRSNVRIRIRAPSRSVLLAARVDIPSQIAGPAAAPRVPAQVAAATRTIGAVRLTATRVLLPAILLTAA